MTPFQIGAVVVYLLGAGVDAWTTKRGLKRGAKELNPIMKALMKVMGRDWAMTALKGGMLGILIWQQMWGAIMMVGAAQWLAAISNHFGLLTKLVAVFRKKKGRLP